VDELAQGMVTLKIPDEDAWEFAIAKMDAGTIGPFLKLNFVLIY
jgi:hypothetical protein